MSQGHAVFVSPYFTLSISYTLDSWGSGCFFHFPLPHFFFFSFKYGMRLIENGCTTTSKPPLSHFTNIMAEVGVSLGAIVARPVFIHAQLACAYLLIVLNCPDSWWSHVSSPPSLVRNVQGTTSLINCGASQHFLLGIHFNLNNS